MLPSCCLLLTLVAAVASASDVLDLSDNSLHSFKSAIADYDAILVEFCEYKFSRLQPSITVLRSFV